MRRSIPFVVAMMLSVPTLAKDVQIGQSKVALTPPTNQCELDPTKPPDTNLIRSVETMLAGTNKLLGIFADCKELANWRSGKRQMLENFAQYQTLASMVDAPPPPAPESALKEMCAHLRAEGEKTMVGLAADIKTRVEQTLKEVKLNQVRFLGVVAEDPNACYAVSVQRFKAASGKDVTQVALYATSFVRGKIVYYYLFAPYQTNFTVPALLARHKPNVAAFLAANKN